MMIDGWSVALTAGSLGLLFVGSIAARTGFRILRHWNHEMDTALQLRLEDSQLLAAALVEYGCVFQILTLFLLVLAADSFSAILVGAMCSTGALTANGYGLPSLLLKIVSAFLCWFWLLLHRLDMSSEQYPLVRLKYRYILVFAPVLAGDFLLQSLYLVNLDPDVLTSCCGVLFRPDAGDGFNLLSSSSVNLSLFGLYGSAIVLLVLGVWIRRTLNTGGDPSSLIVQLFSVCWFLLLLSGLWSVTVFFSSYIYALPSHRCPFDIVQSEYGYIGYPIYLSLFGAAGLGIGCGVAHLVRHGSGLEGVVRSYQQKAVTASLILLAVFILTTGYAPFRYFLLGGEV